MLFSTVFLVFLAFFSSVLALPAGPSERRTRVSRTGTGSKPGWVYTKRGGLNELLDIKVKPEEELIIIPGQILGVFRHVIPISGTKTPGSRLWAELFKGEEFEAFEGFKDFKDLYVHCGKIYTLPDAVIPQSFEVHPSACAPVAIMDILVAAVNPKRGQIVESMISQVDNQNSKKYPMIVLGYNPKLNLYYGVPFAPSSMASDPSNPILSTYSDDTKLDDHHDYRAIFSKIYFSRITPRMVIPDFRVPEEDLQNLESKVPKCELDSTENTNLPAKFTSSSKGWQSFCNAQGISAKRPATELTSGTEAKKQKKAVAGGSGSV